ncbi:MAG: hypothetical protein AAGU75_04675 [Bacillota bacterium]
MTRTFDKLGRIYISGNWMKHCEDSTAVITIKDGGIAILPYDQQKHHFDVQLCRRLDERARVKIPPDILKALNFTVEEKYHLYIGSDNTALLRRMGDYCDVCGQQTQTQMVLGRNICTSCLDILKRSE